ncbi:hypothetical protein NL676_012735 [Syzygium grande]|nr:hypothetical protein NL676_012735 [Syzygium grande]
MNQPGKSVGVIGLGGLGHVAVKFAKAFGVNVTVFSTSMSKKNEALNLLKADKFVLSSDKEQMAAMAKSLDFIVDTASRDHPLDLCMSLLKTGGVLALVGLPGEEIELNPLSLLMDKHSLHKTHHVNLIFLSMRSISGSVVGDVKRMQEMIDFCAEHEIYPEVEVVPIQYANEALERLQKSDVKYHFVIDIENSLK